MTQMNFAQSNPSPTEDWIGKEVTTSCIHLAGRYRVERIKSKDFAWPIAFLTGGEKSAWCKVSDLRKVEK